MNLRVFFPKFAVWPPSTIRHKSIIFTREPSDTSSKMEQLSQALKGHFFTDQYLSVLIPESYTNLQECIILKS